MGISFAFSWEVALMVWLQSTFGALGNCFGQFFTLFSEEAVLVILLGFFYWCLDKEQARRLGVYLLVNILLCPILKNCFPRRRPYMDHGSIQCRKSIDASADINDPAAQGFSFPSMHTSNSTALYTSLGLYTKRKWLRVILFALPFCVALARVLLGVHYPTDVLAGLVIGYCVLALMTWIQTKIKRDWVLYLAILLCALPAVFFCRSNDFFSAYGLTIGIFGGFLFEKRFVKFTNTRSVWKMILRTVGGLLFFVMINALCKLVMPSSVLYLRILRYALGSFCIVGVYPLLFSKN